MVRIANRLLPQSYFIQQYGETQTMPMFHLVL